MKTPKTRNNNTWSEARYRSFIRSTLRRASMRWGPINSVKKKAWVERGKYFCAGCKQVVPLTLNKKKNVFVDHKVPVVDTEEGFQGWDVFIERLFCEESNLEVLCKECHTNLKSRGENEERKKIAFYRDNYSTTYSTWINMNQRCSNPNSTGYQHYGGRGVKVCDRWAQGNGVSGIENFIEDMGYRPEGTTLDRIDYNGDYNKSNCRWATAKEQARNTSTNNWIDYGGESKILEEWAEDLSIKANTILTRLRRGWSVGEALEKEDRNKPDYSGRFTPDDFEYMISETLKGVSQTEIAQALEADSSQVSRHLSRLGVKQPVPVTNSRLTKLDRENIILLRNKGVSATDLAEKYTVHVSTIYNVLKGKYG